MLLLKQRKFHKCTHCTLLTTAIWQNLLNLHLNLFPFPVILTQIQVKFKKFCQIAVVSRVHFWNCARVSLRLLLVSTAMFLHRKLGAKSFFFYLVFLPWCCLVFHFYSADLVWLILFFKKKQSKFIQFLCRVIYATSCKDLLLE